jgi:hypothetical protein
LITGNLLTATPRLTINFTYQIADRFISVDSPDKPAAQSVDRFITELRAARVVRHDGPEAKLTLRRGSSPLASNVRRCFTSVEAATEVAYYSGDSAYIITLGDSTVSADDSVAVEINLAADLDCQSFLFQRVFIHGFATSLRRVGAFELHCAAVVAPGASQATLIVGSSGSGKSTLALQLAATGWDFSTDDVALLTQTENGVEAHGLRRHFAVTRETIANSSLDRFGAEVLKTGAVDDKYPVKPESWFPARHIQKCRPRSLVFSERSGVQQSQARRLNKAEVMQRLLRMCPWICMDLPIAPAYLQLLDSLSRQCAGFELKAGTDLLGNEDYVSDFLGSLVDGAK